MFTEKELDNIEIIREKLLKSQAEIEMMARMINVEAEEVCSKITRIRTELLLMINSDRKRKMEDSL
jgi:hypothetical protein